MKQTLKIGQKYRVIKSDNYPERVGKIVIVKRLDDDGVNDSFYDKNGDFYWFITDTLQLIPKTKKVKKWKLTRKQWFVMCGHILPQWAKDELFATQPQPIKEEGMTVKEFIDTSKKIREDLKQQSKDIEPFKTVFTYSKNYLDLCATQTPEFKKWVKQVTDTLNSLTKRNIK